MSDHTKLLLVASVSLLAGVALEKKAGVSQYLSNIPVIGGLFA